MLVYHTSESSSLSLFMRLRACTQLCSWLSSHPSTDSSIRHAGCVILSQARPSQVDSARVSLAQLSSINSSVSQAPLLDVTYPAEGILHKIRSTSVKSAELHLVQRIHVRAWGAGQPLLHGLDFAVGRDEAILRLAEQLDDVITTQQTAGAHI
mmetsp:Transcript_23879/g.66727  ORF Transcript_23879/g.66727 Transcript_23879/m.66727 type:complete len:153 (-) Transcript_23879:123-581(-)